MKPFDLVRQVGEHKIGKLTVVPNIDSSSDLLLILSQLTIYQNINLMCLYGVFLGLSSLPTAIAMANFVFLEHKAIMQLS